MSKTVLGIFDNRQKAERAIKQLRERGFEKEISVIAKDEGGNVRDTEFAQDFTESDAQASEQMFGGDDISDGSTTGGVLGGLAGLALGAGAIAIPGIGPIVAAGPIAGMLTGIAGGGVAGALVDLGIPEERGQFFEDRVKQGDVLVSVQSDSRKADEAEKLLEELGGSNVESHEK
ncbi:MAG TPA: hypothetical protein VFD15_06770 [Clostridia bacterium]|nr:hypothetical protein [Clostridia bacterium]